MKYNEKQKIPQRKDQKRRFILYLGQKKAKIKLSLTSKCLNCIFSTQEQVVE